MDKLRVLYDGWPLVHAPLSPQAIHLQAVLAYIPSEVSAVVALPYEPPAWLGNIEKYVHVTSNSRSGRLRWEQLTLPRLVRKFGAGVLHLTTPTAPLLSDVGTLVSPCDYDDRFTLGKNLGDCRGFAGRLRCSFARGGMSRVKGFLWPDDLSGTSQSIPLIELPPMVPPDFIPEAELDSLKSPP
jgi:hypothetical protein